MNRDYRLKAFGLGSVGEKIRDLQGRLISLGYSIHAEEFGTRFGESTEAAVKEFQQRSGLNTDGIVGSDTWEALVSAGYHLGDRLLYHRTPMLKGDDVSELQSRLNSLGFSAGLVDGVFGPETAAALRDFQRNAGITVDGVFGPETAAALTSLGAKASPVATGPPAQLIRTPSTITGRRILVDPLGAGGELPGPESVADEIRTDRATLAIANELLLDLKERGATPLQSRSTGQNLSPEERAAIANDADVDAVISFGFGWLPDPEASGISCYYFADSSRESVAGRVLARLCLDSLVAATRTPDCRIHGRNWAILRMTRAPAVLVEIGFFSNSDQLAEFCERAPWRKIGSALGGAIEKFFAGPEQA